MRPTFLTSYLTTCLLSVAAAQNESRGPLAGAGMAITVEGGHAGAADARTLVHKNGFTAGAPDPFPAVNPSPATPVPPDLEAILAGTPGGAGLDTDDFSTGMDVVLVDETGTIDVTQGFWGVFAFSLRAGATGAPPPQPGNPDYGARIRAEAALGSVGGAVFSWVLPGSALPPQLVATVERSHSRRELGLVVGSEVDGLDFPATLGVDQSDLIGFEPFWVSPPPGPARAPLPVPMEIYFTLSSASAGAAPSSWFTYNGVATTPSGATILMVSRSVAFGTFSPPRVFRPYFELGLGATEDIDGLAYDAAAQKLVYSTTGTARDPFLFAYFGTDGANPVHEPVKAPGPNPPAGTPVSDAVGLGDNDDVDAICTLDPRIRNGVYPATGDPFGISCGSPRPGFFGVPALHASAYRRPDGGQTFYDTWMLGWPPLTGRGPGFAVAFLTFGDTSSPVLQASPVLLRAPLSPIPGDPKTYSLPLPPGPAGLALTGLPVTLRWFATDDAFTELAEAWPVKVFL
jgi:hypothetical protein